MNLSLGQIIVISILETFTCIGVGALTYNLLPIGHKHKAILVGTFSVLPVMAAFYYIVL